MTRINSGISVGSLIDSHLFSEYRELKRIPNTITSGKAVIKDIPKTFSLNKGHVKFYYPRLKYLHKRSDALYQELLRRGYNVEDYSSCFQSLPLELYNDWDDTEAKPILVERISERLRGMKNIKYNREPITIEEAINKLNE
jgi:deoxyribonuclease (pyrimidine dimer)